MDYFLLFAGLGSCCAAGVFGVSRLKFIDFFVITFLLLFGNYLIGQALK